jgi:hypothetical protein
LWSTGVTLAFTATQVTVRGWGNEGHRTVALIAQSQLTSNAIAGIKTLVGELALEALATCPDEVRSHERNPGFVLSPPCLKVFPSPQPIGTGNWHFVNLDVTVPDPTDTAMDAFCKNDCVVAKILSFHQILSDKTGQAAARAQALAFLIHFVGDIHQPLHAAERQHDHGGNLLMVSIPAGPGATAAASQDNLHHAWDTFFVNIIAGDEASLVAKLAPQISAARAEAVPAQLGPWVHTWARQSEDFARDIAYRDQNKDIDPNSKPTLSAAYEQAAMATIGDQLAKGGFA